MAMNVVILWNTSCGHKQLECDLAIFYWNKIIFFKKMSAILEYCKTNNIGDYFNH
jgi:hypothetical protein